MSFSLTDLTTPTTVAEARASVYNVLGILGVNTTDWRPGAVVRTMITAFCVLFASCTNLIASIAKGGFLALAAKLWLTLVARYVYGIERFEATYATGLITFNNPTDNSYGPEAAGDVVVRNPVTGATYESTESLTLPPSSSVTIAVRCQQQGSFGTSESGQITELQSPSFSGVEITNSLPLVGSDEEEDEALRTRCSEKAAARSPNGPREAYGYFARSAIRADGTTIGVTRVKAVLADDGLLHVYVALPTGAVSGDADDPDTDLGAIHDTLQRNAAPLDTTEITHSAVELPLNVNYVAYVYNTAGYTVDQIQLAIRDSLRAMMTATPIGGNLFEGQGYLFLSDVYRAIGAASIEGVRLPIFRVVINFPAGDTAIASGSVPLLDESNGVIHLIAPEGL